MHFDYLDDRYALIDAPGSVGFAADGALGMAAADLALVVVDPDPARALLAEPTLRRLEALGIPHMHLRQQDRSGARLDPGAAGSAAADERNRR